MTKHFIGPVRCGWYISNGIYCRECSNTGIEERATSFINSHYHGMTMVRFFPENIQPIGTIQ